MLGWFRDHMDRFGVKRKVKDGENPEILRDARQFIVDAAWKWLHEHKGVDRQMFNSERAPMPLHVHAVFANVL